MGGLGSMRGHFLKVFGKWFLFVFVFACTFSYSCSRSINWFDTWIRFLDPWSDSFGSLIRIIDSTTWFDSLIRFIESIHWFDSLIRFLIRFFDSLSCRIRCCFSAWRIRCCFSAWRNRLVFIKKWKNHYVFHQKRIRCCFCVKQLSSQKCVKRNRLDKNR